MAEIKQVLAGIDGLEAADHAALMAAEMAARFAARLTLVYVVAPPAYPAEVFGATEKDLATLLTRYGNEALATTVDHVRRPGLEVQTRIEFGQPAEELLKVSEELPADLIVVGARRRRAIARVLLGDVSTRLVHLATRPVLVVH